MIYYVRSGDLDVRTEAINHKQAAVKTLNASGLNLGVCVVVSKAPINDDNAPGQVYFLTESILEECSLMRLVR